jgi:autotransporter-associated beta strand protein
MTCLMATWLPGPARGATLYWDNSGVGGAAPVDGSGIWDTTATNLWSDLTSNVAWSSATPDNAIFGFGGAGGVISLGESITVGTLTFNATSGGTYTISPTAAQTLTINGGISANETAAITANTILGGAQTWTTAVTKTLTVGGNVNNGGNLLTLNGAGNTTITGIIGAGAGGVTQSGVGTVTLSGVNTYSGTTTVSSGILRATTSASALGAGTLALSGGDLQLANDTGLAFNRNTTVSGNATITSDRVTPANPGVTHTLGTLSIGANTLSIVRGANATTGTGGVTVGAVTLTGGATFDVQSNALLTTGAISGANAVTKTGAGQLTNNNASSFNGIVTLSGGTFSTNSLAAGSANSGIGASSNAATNLVLDGGGLQYTGTVISTDRLFTLTNNGGTLDASGAANAALTFANVGTMALSGSGTRTLTLAGASTGNNLLMAIIGDEGANATSIAKTGVGRWVLGGVNTFTGGISVSGGNLALTTASSNSGAVNAITLSGGSLDLRDDGSGFGNRQDIVFGDNVVVSGNSTISVDRTGLAGFPGSTALNKTIQLGTLSIGTNSLTTNNLNGYGLEFTGTTTLSGVPSTFIILNPTTANTSNIVAGLELSGQITGTGAINVGTGGGAAADGGIGGTLLLSNATNDFIGNMTIVRGVLAATSDGALGNTANDINLSASGTGAVAAFRAAGDINLDAGRVISFNNATATNNVIEVIQGSTLTLNSAFGGANGFVKADNGTLAINVSNGAWVGTTTINAGAVNITDANALGATGGATTVGNFVGAALQLSGAGITYAAEPLNLNSTGINTGGALQNLSGNNTWTGPITLQSAATIGSDFDTLTLGGATGISGAFGLTLAGAGNILISTALNANVTGLTKIGAGTATLGVANSSFVSAITVNQGTFAVSGAGVLGATGAITINPGATLLIDNTASAVTNRLGGRPITLSGGNVTLIGNAAATNETLGTWTLGRGQSNVSVTAGAGGANLTFGSFATNNPQNGGTVRFSGTNLGAAAGAGNATIKGNVSFVGQTAASGTNKGILPWALAEDTTTSAIGFATASTATGVIRLLTPAEKVSTTTLTTNANQELSGAAVSAASVSLNSLSLLSGGGVTLTSTFPNVPVLTIQSGGILAKAGNTGINGGVLLANVNVATNSRPFYFHTLGDLDVNSVMLGIRGLAKAGAGTLTISQQSMLGRDDQTNNVIIINEGTLKLNAGTNTLYFRTPMIINGGKLDLNNTSQYVMDLMTDGVFNGGEIISTGGNGVILANQQNVTRSWAGNIGGSTNDYVTFARTGSSTLNITNANTTTGKLILLNSTTNVTDAGSFANVSGITVSRATFAIRNDGLYESVDRINDIAPITLQGGFLGFYGRAQSSSSESVGVVTLEDAMSTIHTERSTVGLSTMNATLAGLNRNASKGATVNFASGGSTTGFGAIGNNAHLLITGYTFAGNTTNNILGGWAVVNGAELATYVDGLGVAALNNPGAPGYSGTTFPVASQPTQNIRLAATGAVPSLTAGADDYQLNSLTVPGNFNITFADATDTLNLISGGLVKSGNNGNSIGATVDSGRLTAGGAVANSDLFVFNNQNTLTINSRIVDNAGGAVRLITSGAGAVTLTNTNNSYTGGTVVNSGTLNLSNAAAGVVLPGGGLTISSATVTMNGFNNQIDASNVVTMRGAATLNLFGNNTLAGLIFDADGSNTALNIGANIGNNVNSFGVLTLTGDITASASTVRVESNESPIITFGVINLGATNHNITVNPTTIDGKQQTLLQPALSMEGIIGTGGIVKLGDGALRLRTAQTYSGLTDVQAGAIVLGSIGNAGSRFSTYNFASGTQFELLGTSTVIGGLSGSGTVSNLSSGAVTLGFGFNNQNTTFSGVFNRGSDAFPNTLNVQKYGSGTTVINGATSTTNGTTGALTVSGGVIEYSGAGATTFRTVTVQRNSTLTLNNASSNVNNRLNMAVTAAANGTLNLSGGTLRIVGNASAGTTESVGTLNLNGGSGIINLEPTSAQNVTLTAHTLGTVAQGGTALLRGPNLGGTIGAGTSNFVIATGGAINQIGGAGAVGTTTMSIRPDILGDLSLTGSGTGFVTYIGAGGVVNVAGGNGFRLLAANELAPFLSSGATTNVALGYQHGGAFITGTTINSLTLNQHGGTMAAGPISQGTVLTITSGGIIAQAGNRGISGGLLSVGANPAFIHAIGDLNFSAGIVGSAGMTKSGAGTLNLNRAQFYTGATSVNNGTLVLNGGNNTLFVNAIGGANALNVNGGILDLNGNSQVVSTLAASNITPGVTASIINNGSAATLTSTGGGIFAGNINGNLNFVRAGNNTTTFSGANTYTGTTTVRGGNLVLQSSGTIANSTAVNVRFGGLIWDDYNGVNPGTTGPTRIAATAPITLQGGNLQIRGTANANSTLALQTVNVEAGRNFIMSNAYSSSALTLNIGNLNRAADAVIEFRGSRNEDPNSDGLGQPGVNNSRIFVSNLNSSPFSAASLTNNIIGGWAVVRTSGGMEFASYNNTNGLGALNVSGFPGYNASTLPASPGSATQNIRLSSNSFSIPDVAGAGVYNLNGLSFFGTATGHSINFTDGADTLNLTSGGLLKSGNFTGNIGATVDSGRLTAGGTGTGVNSLYVYNNESTLTINSRIVNNASGGQTRLVITGASNVTLTAPNTYTGGTVLNSATTNLIGVANQTIPAGGLTINNAAATMIAGSPNQINSANDITINGGGVINFWGNHTQNGTLTFNNSGGAGNPTFRTQSVTSNNSTTATNNSTLTLSGAGSTLGLAVGMPVTGTNIPAGTTVAAILSGTTVQLSQPATGAATDVTVTFGSTLTLNNNITSTSDSLATFPLLSVSTNGKIDIGAATRTITTNGNAALALILPTMIGTTAGITKEGTSGLRLDGVNYYTGATALNAGTLFLGIANTIPYASTFTMAGTSRLDLNNFDQVLSQLSGSGDITNNSGSGRTLTFGLNNANTTFDGRFLAFNDAVLSTLNVSKIGSGSFGLTGGDSTSTATFNIYGGAVTYSGTASTAFGSNVINQTGSLILDNTGTNENNRLGGLLKGLTVAGGEFKIQGNAGGSSESLGALTTPNGGGVITLVPGAGSTVLNFASVHALAGGATYLVRGDSLGSTPGAGVANVFASSVAFSGGNAIAGLANISTRPDMVGDASATGTGTGFLTYTAGSGFRVLGANETLGSINNMFTTTANLAKSANETFTTNNVATVTLNSGGQLTGFNTGSILTISSIGIIAKTGNVGFSGGQINPGASSMFIHALDNLTVDSYVLGNGITKDGAGNLSFNRSQYFGGFLNNNEGTTTLNSGAANTILVAPTAAAVTTIALTANAGTVDLNGQNQAFAAIASINNPLPGTGSLITSATPAILTSTGGGTFGGVIGGAITFDRSGNNTTLLTSAQTYTGATNVRGGTLQLRDSASLASTAGLNLEFGAVNIDNAGTAFNSAPANLADRILDANAISIRGGTITLSGIQGQTVTETLGSVTVLGGNSTITATPGNTGRAVLTITDLARAAGSGSRVNFTGVNLGFADVGSSQILLTALNGVAPTLASNLLGGWAVVNGTEFASWTAPKGVGALNSAGYAGYTGTTITAGSNPAHNIRLTATGAIGAADTLNSLNMVGDINLTFAAATNTLNIVSGGLLKSGNTANTIGAAADSGRLTAGGTNTGIQELFIMNNQNTLTVNSRIIDNGSGGLTRLVIAGAGTVSLTAPNTYTGDTVINSTTTLNGAAAVVVIPNPGAVGGNTLTINNAALTMVTNAGQIGANNNLVLNGDADLTYVGANTLNGTITFNTTGGSGTSVLTTGGTLTLNGDITSVNDHFLLVPTIAGVVNFGAGARTVDASGLALNNLVISAQILGSGGSLTKTGAGALSLTSATSNFTGGVNLNVGSIIIGANDTLTAGVKTGGPLGLGTLSIASGLKLTGANTTVYNPVTLATNTLDHRWRLLEQPGSQWCHYPQRGWFTDSQRRKPCRHRHSRRKILRCLRPHQRRTWHPLPR